MSRLPDAGTLDALVLGTSDLDDSTAWESLVRHPEGARAWLAAVERRKRLDRLASAVRGRAWLARATLLLTRANRRMARIPAGAVSILFPDSELDTIAAATLGSTEGHESTRILQARWGEVVPASVAIGARVTLQLSAPVGTMDVRFLFSTGQGLLATRTWRLEAGEAPVLLVALLGADPAAPLEEAMSNATAMAGVLLLEAPSDLL